MAALLRIISAVTAAAALLFTAAPASADASVYLINGDAAGVGLNDPSPRAPVGGNTGTTLGQQRLIALQHAADIWGSQLDSPVPIGLYVSFGPRTCTATGAVLASAGAWNGFANFPSAGGGFPGPVQADTWHHSALADKRAGADLTPGDPDVIAIFNVNLGQPNCFAGPGFYYGLDGNEPPGGTDLVAVALHEFAHGLGFAQFASVTTGVEPLGFTDVYGLHLLDTSTMKTWDQMTDAERAASAINSRKVVWEGAEVTAGAPSVLEFGVPLLTVTAPAGIAGSYEVGTASFGAPLTAAGVAGQVVLALDAANAAGPSSTDGCTPLTNAAAVAGRIALVDRGTCGFIVKAANLQAAGAIAMLVADNAPGAPPAGLGGVDPALTIPSVRLTITDGALIKAQLATGVFARLGLDMTRRAGTDSAGRVLMNAPNPVVPGSSISHWDPIAFKNLLMEPAINPDLTHLLVPPRDLTVALMHDIGWFPDADNDGFADTLDECDGSDLSEMLSVDGEATSIVNVLFANGCTMSDYVLAAAAAANNHGGFVSEIAHLGNAWRSAGLISDSQRAELQTAAAHSSVGKKKK
jgi:hypothetical protein